MLFELMSANMISTCAKMNKSTTEGEQTLEVVSPFEGQDVNWERRNIAVDGTIEVDEWDIDNIVN